MQLLIGLNTHLPKEVVYRQLLFLLVLKAPGSFSSDPKEAQNTANQSFCMAFLLASRNFSLTPWIKRILIISVGADILGVRSNFNFAGCLRVRASYEVRSSATKGAEGFLRFAISKEIACFVSVDQLPEHSRERVVWKLVFVHLGMFF